MDPNHKNDIYSKLDPTNTTISYIYPVKGSIFWKVSCFPQKLTEVRVFVE